jgi:hypothetical protein
MEGMRRAKAASTMQGDIAQALHGARHVERLIFNCRHYQVACRRQGGAADFLVGHPDDELVDTAYRCRTGLAESRWNAGQVLQLDHHVFHDMGRPGAFAQALQETAALAHAAFVLDQSRQPGGQAFVKPGNRVRW